MSLKLSSGLTIADIISGLGELLTLGLDALGQEELVPLVAIAERLAGDGAAMLAQSPNPTTVLTSEIDAEQAAADEAETAKYPIKKNP